MQHASNSPEQTISLGEKLATKLKGGDIVALHGELGTGKTTFVKGIAKGLGIKEEITSPTFTLIQVYNLQTCKLANLQTFVHIDTYRLKNEQELIEIGAEDYVGESETICVIEWPEKIKNLLQSKKVIDVYLEHARGGNERKIVADL